jgi:hypothetical protein
MYGEFPDFELETEVFKRPVTNIELGDKATQEEIALSITHGNRQIKLTMLLTLPRQAPGPIPMFVGLNFYGNHVTSTNEEVSLNSNYVINSNNLGITNHIAGEDARGKRSSNWPVKMILEKGYGLATIHCADIDPDFDDGFQNGVHSLLANGSNAERQGTISAWAWGLSRAMDYLETDDRIDDEKVAVIGHSRLGKAALWAGANDQRFALVISNNSGCGGAALSRRQIGETVEAINTNFPHWFCKNFKNYHNKEDDLPIDQHLLIALMAPRPVYVASASEDLWADPKGEYMSLSLSSPVYQLYGFEHLLKVSQPPVDEPLIVGKQGYHIRTGKHALTEYDWEQYLDFADKHFGRRD